MTTMKAKSTGVAVKPEAVPPPQVPIQVTLLNALPHPVIFIGADDRILEANDAAQNFFQSSASFMRRHLLDHFIPNLLTYCTIQHRP